MAIFYRQRYISQQLTQTVYYVHYKDWFRSAIFFLLLNWNCFCNFLCCSSKVKRKNHVSYTLTIYRNTGFVEGYMHHILKLFQTPEYIRDLVTASFCRMPRDVTKICRSIHSFYIRSLDNQQHVTGERRPWTCKHEPEMVSKVIWFSVGLGKNMWYVEYCSRVTFVDTVWHTVHGLQRTHLQHSIRWFSYGIIESTLKAICSDSLHAGAP